MVDGHVDEHLQGVYWERHALEVLPWCRDSTTQVPYHDMSADSIPRYTKSLLSIIKSWLMRVRCRGCVLSTVLVSWTSQLKSSA